MEPVHRHVAGVVWCSRGGRAGLRRPLSSATFAGYGTIELDKARLPGVFYPRQARQKWGDLQFTLFERLIYFAI